MEAVLASIETFTEGRGQGCEVRQLGYLRCCLAFLNGNAKNVLSDNAVQLSHRLAFAAHYLPDDDLVIVLQLYLIVSLMTHAQVKCLLRVSDWAVKQGNLTGLLITGLTPRGGELIENYVKRSGDVQTAALLGLLAQPKGFADGRGLRWLETYRDLMDTWCMHIQVWPTPASALPKHCLAFKF
jgi:hypothetical protein